MDKIINKELTHLFVYAKNASPWELLEEEDKNVPGVYVVEVNAGHPPDKSASIALDIFHSRVAIGMLDDFEISVVGKDGQVIPQDEAHEDYSGENEGGGVWQVIDTSEKDDEFFTKPAEEQHAAVMKAYADNEGNGLVDPAHRSAQDPHDKPMAVVGLISYRYKGPKGWIMIGASDDADALREAARSTEAPDPKLLQVWTGGAYVACLTDSRNSSDKLIRITTSSGRALYYTGKIGDKWLTQHRHEAFTYENDGGVAQLKADALRDEWAKSEEYTIDVVDGPAHLMRVGLTLASNIVAEYGGTIGPWSASGTQWQYTDIQMRDARIRLGVSTGGVVQVNGAPFTPDLHDINITPQAVRKSVVYAMLHAERETELNPLINSLNDADVRRLGTMMGESDDSVVALIRKLQTNTEVETALAALAEEKLRPLTEQQIETFSEKLTALPHYERAHYPYIEFDEAVVCHDASLPKNDRIYSKYRLRVVMESDGGCAAPWAYYVLSLDTPNGWSGEEVQKIPEEDYVPVMSALHATLQSIRDAGINLTGVFDQSPYAFKRVKDAMPVRLNPSGASDAPSPN